MSSKEISKKLEEYRKFKAREFKGNTSDTDTTSLFKRMVGSKQSGLSETTREKGFERANFLLYFKNYPVINLKCCFR